MKNKILHIVNWMLLFSMPAMLLTVDIKTDTINLNVDTKNLQTNLLQKVVEVRNDNTNVEDKSESEEEPVDKEVEKKVEDSAKKQIEEVNDESDQTQAIEETPVIKEEKQEQQVQSSTEKYETYTGNLSYYRATCTGCSGYTATGYDVRDGKLYYNDSTYGNVRIVAAGTEIPKYSIVRIKNSSLGADVLAIVLDRGGNIGQGKKFIVDILTNSTEAKGGIDYGVSIEVIRKGK